MIIVTGANGFIGSVLSWQLNQAQIPILACVDKVSLNERASLLKSKKFDHFLLKDDLWNFLDLPETIQKTSWIIHMGANSSTTETDWDQLYNNNTLYTKRIFEWCAKNGKSLIYASSAATYGDGEAGYDDSFDSEKLKPLNLYGESKVQFDRWALKQKRVPPNWYGLKFFNVYGPNEYHKESMSSVVYKAFHQIQKSGTLQLFKSHRSDYQDGEQKRDFVYVKDVATWILELIQKKPKSGLYNMGFGTPRTWLDLGRAVFNSSGKREHIDFIEMPENIRDQYQYYTCANMKKWLSQGMSAPKWSLESGVDDYVKNYLSKDNAYL